ncbi:MAG TPA: T9SS type A sorting domain-containing protein [Parafilimonas sp.]|nr:T9SS type A sorting domain-containing protein [Parafilimonas sp.]
MKNKFLHPFFFALALAITLSSFSQSKRFFAVTGDQFGSVNWITFREFNPDAKTPVRTLYIPAQGNETIYDALSGQQLISNNESAVAAAPQTCGCLNKRMVAAIAYDAKNNRLYYTQMLGNQLRYLDLNSTDVKSYAVTTQLLKNFPNQQGEASVITRMAIASDNNGYALTNDNEHLIRFTTGRQASVTDLGRLADAKSNGENSVRTQYKSWGGDLIADANGNLYLFTMQRLVYKINPKTKLATYLGQIKNMPEDYTVNAAMVENDAYVIVGSSTKTTNYYRVNLSTLESEAIVSKTAQVYNVSDFANESLAFNKANNNSSVVASNLKLTTVGVYPNPATDGKLTIQFGNFTPGKYNVQIADMQGKAVMQKEVKISGSQTEGIFVSSLSTGTYLLRVLDQDGKNLYTRNVVIGK